MVGNFIIFGLAVSLLGVAGALTVALLARAAIADLIRFQAAVPDNTSLVQQLDAMQTSLSEVRRGFLALEEDVEGHLQQATSRMQRAKARETTEKRTARNQQVNGPASEEDAMEMAFQAAEAARIARRLG